MKSILFKDHENWIQKVWRRRQNQIENEKFDQQNSKADDPFIAHRDKALKLKKQYGYAESVVAGLDTDKGEETKKQTSGETTQGGNKVDFDEEVMILVTTEPWANDKSVAQTDLMSRSKEKYSKWFSKFMFTCNQLLDGVHERIENL